MNAVGDTFLFWAVAALGAGLALAFVLPFLLRQGKAAPDQVVRRDVNLAVYRDQMRELKAEHGKAQMSPEQFQADKREIEARAAEDALSPQGDTVRVAAASRRLGFTLAAVLPAAAFGLYFWLGNPAVLTAVASGPGAVPTSTPTEDDILGMIGQIETRLQAQPGDAAGWEALGMANALVARWPQAAKAYEEADRLQPDKPSILTGRAESLAMARDQTLAGEPIELVERALRVDPTYPKALELAGIHAYQTQDFARAVTMLDRLSSRLAPDSAHAREVLAMRDDAQLRLQGAGADGTRAAGAGASVSGRVEVAEALRSRIGPQHTVFVLARAGDVGPPLAAVRVPAGPLPLAFSLNDSMSMVPGQVLSKHQDVTLVARISASGNPIAQPGDLEGRLTRVAVGSTDVKLVIDRVLP